ncbi:hypothetical protein TSUD_407620 [Trifolium subterraneum]|uniref:Uncharacterized protein n=1 Tax=Trifolium subterraneum TaxID=3900 RepID=A0A2Z6NZG7_TRISU|nr:hypothetical protein TSUD_407620 [Trifolium subterraneum]
MESLNKYEREAVTFLATFNVMSSSDLLARETAPESLGEYMSSMSNLSADERMTFVLKARELKQKAAAAASVNPLSQLVVDESAPKGTKRKNKEESRRISLAIPNKGGDFFAEEEKEEEGEVLVGPAKKKRNNQGKSGRGVLAGGSSKNQGEPETITKVDVLVRFKYGNSSFFSDTSSKDLRKMGMNYHIRGSKLSYFLSARQELEVMEANNKIKLVDENLGSIEKQYAATKAKFERDIKDLKASCEEKIKEAGGVEDEQRTVIASANKERDEAVLQRDQLSKEKDILINKVEGLQVDLGSQYDDGFQFALEQVKIVFLEVYMAMLGELGALNKIVDGKLVLFTPPSST